MDIQIDGSRATGENWLLAHQLPSTKLPALTEAELRAAKSLGITAEEYARSLHATDLTDIELGKRAEAVAKWIGRWLAKFAPQWTVQQVLSRRLRASFA